MLSAEDLKNVIEGIINETLLKKGDQKQDKLLTVAEVCNELGVDRSTLWRWEREHYLMPVRLGSKVKYKMSDIESMKKGGASC